MINIIQHAPVQNAFQIMSKSNSKQLYQLAKRLRNNQMPTNVDDSLDAGVKKEKKTMHSRAQSCPFNPSVATHIRHPTFPLPQQPALRLQPTNCSVPTHNKPPSQQWPSSQGSMSSQTVIIREVDALQKVGKKRLRPKGECFTKTKVSQQMRSYQLRNELANVQKEAMSTSIKQRIMEGLLLRCDNEILEHSFEFA